MEVTYNGSKQGLEKDRLVEKATEQLEEIIGAYSATVKAEWDRKQDQWGNASYMLRLYDWRDTATTSFGPSELTMPLHLRIRLYHLLGEFLQARNERQLEALGKAEE